MIDLHELKKIKNPTRSMKLIQNCYISTCGYLFISYPVEMTILFDNKNGDIPSIKQCVEFLKTGILEKECDKTRYLVSIIFMLNSINSEYSDIIWHSYFRRIHDNRWRNKYSKSSYYRVKIKAITLFVTLLAEHF